MFKVGDKVFKHSGHYTGPGIVRSVTGAGVNIRYVVGHTIQGGQGEFLHIYSEGNLTLLLPAKLKEEPATSTTLP